MLRTICAALPVALAATMPAHAQTVAGQEAHAQLEEIVVTAQRRTENLQAVPLSVTAFGTQALENARINDIRNLSGFSPNVLINNQGISSIPTITIRGIQSGVSNSAVDPKIGIYLDGVYIGRTVGAIFDLADIERVETLRGPQGTLFGRNATGGAISITTPNPSGEFHVRALGSAGNFDSWRGKFSVDFPAMGILKARVSYLHDESAGDTPNLLAGRTINFDQRLPGAGTLRYADRLGGKNVDAVQVALRLTPTERLTFDYKFDYTDSSTVGRPGQVAGFNSDGGGTLAAAIAAFQPMTGGTINLSQQRLATVAAASSAQPLTVQGHSLVALLDLGSVKLKNIAAYREFDQGLNIFDLAASGGQKFTLAQFSALLAGNVAGITAPAAQPGPNDYFFDLLTARKARQHQFSDEFQILASTSAFDLTAGAFFFREQGAETSILGIFQPVVNGVVIPTPLDSTFGSGVNQSVATNTSYAIYGQGDYHISPAWTLTLGGRYTIDDRETNQLLKTGSGAGGTLGVGKFTQSFHKFTYTGIVSYRPDDDLNVYGKVATGYVAGGIADGSAYAPETLTSYELGVKSQLLDRRLRANVSAYYSDYSDLQIQQFLGGRQTFSNAGKARIYGGEIELDAAPVAGLNLTASLGYQHFDYIKYVLNGVDVADVARPLYAPKVTARLAGRYEFGDFGAAGRPFVSADARYRSTTYLTLLPASNPVTEEGTKQDPFWLVDARAGLADMTLFGAQASVSLWVQNLFDKDAYTFGPTVIAQNIFYDPSRTYGIELKVEY